MERIKDAIDRIRHDGSAPTGDKAVDRSPPRQTVDLGNIQPITYTQTRVVALDNDHLERNRIVTNTKTSPYGVAFDILRTRVLHEMQERGYRTLVITSPTPECGKTVLSLNLAFSMAHKSDQTVLLADFDLRKPQIASYLGLPPGPDLLDYLEGKADLPDVLVNPGQPRLVVLPNGRSVSNASEIMTMPRTKSLVKDLRDHYRSRVILFDVPPLLSTDDTLAFLPQIDCALLVVASGLTKTSEIEDSRRLLAKTNLLGVVLNKGETGMQEYY